MEFWVISVIMMQTVMNDDVVFRRMWDGEDADGDDVAI
jgi:hypothetical protein